MDALKSPLSSSQKRLWFLKELGFPSEAYNIGLSVRFVGSLDSCALEQAFFKVLGRHKILRVRIREEEGVPYQEEASDCSDSFNVLSNVTDIEKCLKEDINKPFDFSKDTLIEAKLYKKTLNEHILSIVVHHIVADEWSINLFFSELSSIYNSIVTDTSDCLPPLDFQYVDFVGRHQSILESKSAMEQVSFWKESFSVNDYANTFPYTIKRKEGHYYKSMVLHCHYPKELGKRLKTLCQYYNTTPFIALMSAYQLLLSRYAGTNDVVVGTPLSNRHFDGVESLIGLFVNALPLRLKISDDDTFISILEKVKNNVIDLYENQDIPFEKIVDELNIERNPNVNPIFQTMFFVDTEVLDKNSFSGLECSYKFQANTFAKLDLLVSANLHSDAISMRFEFADGLYEKGFIERLSNNFITLLLDIVRKPTKKVRYLKLLSSAERKEILAANNFIPSPSSRIINKSVMSVLEGCVRTSPLRCAAIFKGKKYTYHDIDMLYRRFSQCLLSDGVKKGSVVGVCITRSLDLMVCMLALFQIGAVYLPINPDTPEKRLRYICENSDAEYLILSELKHFDLTNMPALIFVEQLKKERVNLSACSSELAIDPLDLAYIFYTSGTTGYPKGVKVNHKALLNSYISTTEFLSLNERAVFLAITPHIFDVSLYDYLLPLCSGGSVVIADQSEYKDPYLIKELILRYNVTSMQITPSMLQMLVSADWTVNPSLSIYSAGEALPNHLKRHLAGRCNLYNLYGPTEAVVYATGVKVSASTVENSIGYPLANYSVIILDDHRNMLPFGVEGELHIGGSTLSDGYIKHLDLNAEKFLDIEVGESSPTHWYKTGDIARMQSSGEIEYIGRIDNQAKIRGNRVELEEIEKCLILNEFINWAIVQAREDVLEHKVLVAYYLSDTPIEFNISKYLSGHLPEYMIPSYYMRLDAFPLTDSNKVDRMALPAPLNKQSDLDRQVDGTLSKLESELIVIVENLLNAKSVNKEDNFFNIGGDSIVSIQLVSALRKKGFSIAPRDVFSSPVLKELAKVCESNVAPYANKSFKVDAHVSRYPLSPIQRSLYLHSLKKNNQEAYILINVFKLHSHVNEDNLKIAWKNTIGKYEILRTGVSKSASAPEQFVADDFEMDWEHVEQGGETLNESLNLIDTITEREKNKGFELDKPLLMRWVLVRCKDQDCLIWVYHHILLDGWSCPIIIDAVKQFYDAIAVDTLPQKSPVAQYRNYISWLENVSNESSKSFWKDYLSNITSPSKFDLPRLRFSPDAPNTTNYDSFFSELGVDITNQLNDFSVQYGVTSNTVIQLAWGVVLSAFLQKKDVVFGVVYSGRSIALENVDSIVGPFINTLPFRFTVLSENPLLKHLCQIQKDNLSLQEHAFCSLSDVMSFLSEEIQFDLFDSILVYENYPSPSRERGAGGISIDHIKSHDRNEFPLCLAVNPGSTMRFMYSFQRSHFNKQAVEYINECFFNTLNTIMNHPMRHIENVSVLSGSQQNALVFDFNDTNCPIDKDINILALFTLQASSHPDLRAVVAEDGELTYKELDEVSNEMAHYLRGFVSGEVVAIDQGRSLWHVVTQLAILKSNNAYLALDDMQPANRNSHILNNSNASILITNEKRLNALPKSKAKVINIDLIKEGFTLTGTSRHTRNFLGVKNRFNCVKHLRNRGAITGGTCLVNTVLYLPTKLSSISRHGLNKIVKHDSHIEHNDIAYVVYTSGSTGEPKGVMIEHSSLINFILSFNHLKGATQRKQATAWTSFAFDVSAYEIWSSLCFGETLHILSNEVRMNPDLFFDYIADSAISSAYIPPLFLSQFLNRLKKGKGSFVLEHLLVGVEPIALELMDSVRARLPGINIINGYGPSETTICSTAYLLSEQNPIRYTDIIPIGRPIWNSAIYILSESKRLLPAGVIGEIYIGGAGLARGYLNSENETNLKFIDNPLQPLLGSKLYKTGDLGRWLPDGNMEYIGRNDGQVKIHGVRIETKEVEVHLKAIDSVEDALVTVKEVDNKKRLIGYVVQGEATEGLNEASIRRELLNNIPSFMVPKHFVFISELPITSNGKICIDALPLPSINTDLNKDVSLNENELSLENILLNCFSDVLNVQKPSLDDNFFNLGGDSIIAIQLLLKLKEQKIGIEIKDIFEAPVIKDLLERISITTNKESATPSEADTKRTSFPLSPIQAWFFSQEFNNSNHFNQSFFFNVNTPINKLIFSKVISSLLDAHPMLTATFEQRNDSWKQTYFNERDDERSVLCCDIPSDTVDVLKYRDEVVERLQSSLSIVDGPVFRACLFSYPTGEQSIFMLAHHLSIDSVSWRILLDDFCFACSSIQKNETVNFSFSSSYATWVECLLTYSKELIAKNESQYWRAIADEVFTLPVDKKNALATISSVKTECITLSKSDTSGLIECSSNYYNSSVNALLITALSKAILTYYELDSCQMFLEGHGREYINDVVDITRTVGWFTSIYPVSVNLSDINSDLKSVYDVTKILRSIPKRGIGYGILKYLSDELISNQLSPEICFNYLGQWDNQTSTESVVSFSSKQSFSNHSASNHFLYKFDVNCMVIGGAIKIEWTYSDTLYEKDTIQALLKLYQKNLLSLINSSLSGSISEKKCFPLSPMQHGLLLDHLRSEEVNRSYHVQMLLSSQKKIHEVIFRQAWKSALRQFDVLKMACNYEDVSAPFLVLDSACTLNWQSLDWSLYEESQYEVLLSDLFEKDAAMPFQLNKAPLFRCYFINLSNNESYFFWAHHHILMDGWSEPILMTFLKKAYQALYDKKPMLEDKSIPYTSYLDWISTKSIPDAEAFWKAYLGPILKGTRLTSSTGFKSQRGFGVLERSLTRFETDSIKQFASERNVTVNTVIQFSYALLLGKYTNTSDVLFGVVVSGRNIPLDGVQNILGLFIQTIPLRVKINRLSEISSAMKKIQADMLAVQEYSYLPLSIMQSLSGLDGRSLLFDTILSFTNYPPPQASSNPDPSILEMKTERLVENTGYPLCVAILPRDELTVRFTFSKEYFSDESIYKMLDNFLKIIKKIAVSEGATCE